MSVFGMVVQFRVMNGFLRCGDRLCSVCVKIFLLVLFLLRRRIVFLVLVICCRSWSVVVNFGCWLISDGFFLIFKFVMLLVFRCDCIIVSRLLILIGFLRKLVVLCFIVLIVVDMLLQVVIIIIGCFGEVMCECLRIFSLELFGRCRLVSMMLKGLMLSFL